VVSVPKLEEHLSPEIKLKNKEILEKLENLNFRQNRLKISSLLDKDKK